MLPHPHGASSGQIAHNANYDTGVTPGSVGGKFVGFGEEGTSAVANRAAWALSENIDYLYQKLAKDIAVPAAVSFTSTGQTSYHFSGSVFAGDVSYPGGPSSDPEGMMLLFSVLDSQYNELTDANGNEVRVAQIRDTTNVTDVYQDGFVTNPIVTFCTVNSTTGAVVQNPYSIPASQSVRLLYAGRGNIENIATDSLIRFKVNSAAEASAGTVLQDGTRTMTGDLNLGSNKLLNVSELRGATAANVLLRSQQNMALQGDQLLTFKDQYLGAAINLSQSGQTALGTQFFTSIVGALNSAQTVLGNVAPNRANNRTGTFTNTPAVPSIEYPALSVTINGELRTISSGSITVVAPNLDSNSVLVVTSTGTVTAKTAASVLDTDIPLLSFYFNTGTTTFTTFVDIRLPSVRHLNASPVIVGSVPGASFTDLSTAIDVVSRRNALAGTQKHTQIVVVGEATFDTQVNPATPVHVLGLGISSDGYAEYDRKAVITVSASFTPGNDLIVADQRQLVLENLLFRWTNPTAQTSGKYLAKITAGRSALRRVSTTGTFGGIVLTQLDIPRLDISECSFDLGTAVRTIVAVAAGGTTSSRISIVDTEAITQGSLFFYLDGAATNGLDLNVERCRVTRATGSEAIYAPFSPGSSSRYHISNNTVVGGSRFVSIRGGSAHICGNRCSAIAQGILLDAMSAVVESNDLSLTNGGTSVYGIDILSAVTEAVVSKNRITGTIDFGIRNAGAKATISNNQVNVDGRYGIRALTGDDIVISNNVVIANTDCIHVESSVVRAIVTGNQCRDAANGVRFLGNYGTIVDNIFYDVGGFGIKFQATPLNVIIARNSFHLVDGDETGTPGVHAVISVDGVGGSLEGVIVSDNVFRQCGTTGKPNGSTMTAMAVKNCTSTIRGNIINTFAVTRDTTDMSFIYLDDGSSGSVVEGNQINVDITNSVDNTLQGIYGKFGVDDLVIVSNVIRFKNSASLALNDVRPIYTHQNGGVIGMNQIPSISPTNISNLYAIHATGQAIVAVGNNSVDQQKYSGGGTTQGLLVGNLSRTAYDFGSHLPTTGAPTNLRADINKVV